MNGRNYWETFCHTGKIADYLAYCSTANRIDGEDAGWENKELESDKNRGAGTHAGADSSHRNDFKG